MSSNSYTSAYGVDSWEETDNPENALELELAASPNLELSN
jgi:hypothetical protein